MGQQTNHYTEAFEAYLRSRRIPYVAIDETRRALLRASSLKSMDFILHTASRGNVLVEVKGRRFPSGGEGGHRKWENWVTDDDVECLQQWQNVFGTGFRAAFVFAYHILDDRWRSEFEFVFDHQDRAYAFYAVWVEDYSRTMQRRSPRWATVSVPSGAFRSLRVPLSEFLGSPWESPT